MMLSLKGTSASSKAALLMMKTTAPKALTARTFSSAVLSPPVIRKNKFHQQKKLTLLPVLQTPSSSYDFSLTIGSRGLASQPLGNVMGGAGGGQQKSFMEQFSVDLTEQAKEHKLDPIIGRHDEIRRCLQILARRTKNNPILIGEAGVGKLTYYEL